MSQLRKWIFLLWASSLWSQESSLTMEKCIDMALANSPAIHIAQIQSQVADEVSRQANADMLPSLGFAGSYRRQSTVPELNVTKLLSFLPIPISNAPSAIELGTLDVFDFRMSLTQPLFTGFQLSNRKKITQSNALAKKSDSERSRDELVYKVRTAYGQLLKAQRFAEIARTGQQQVEEHLRVVENFIKQGVATQEDRLRVQVKLSEAQVAVLQADNAVQITRSNLERTIGIPLPVSVNAQMPVPEKIQTKDISTSKQQAIANRNELHAMQFTIQSAESAVKMVRGGYLPSVAAFATYGYGKPGLNFVDKEWMDYWTVGVGMEWNLWNWNKTSSLVQQAQLNASAAAAGLRELQMVVLTDVTMACLQVNEAVERIQLTGQLEQQATESFRIMQNKFNQGVSSNSDFLDAQLDLTRARLQKVQAEVDYTIALANYDRAVGQPYQH
jgi:outer membrane protein